MSAPIRLRLIIENPVPGVRYSLQDARSAPVGATTATDAPLALEPTATLHDDGRLTGPFVRREGPTRRFVYIAIGGQAGGAASCWNRRAKVDVHDIPPELLEAAREGATLEVRLPGRAGDGGPACATVRPIGAWRVG